MHQLISSKGVSETTLAIINSGMEEHFCQAKNRNTRQQSDHKAVGSRMGRQPPTPIQNNIFPWTLFNCHPIPLEGKVSHKMPKNEQDQQLKGLVRRKGYLKHLREATISLLS